VQAIAAGCDLLLYCHSTRKARAALVALEDAVDSGRLPRERAKDALNRVAWAKRRFAVTAG